MYLNIESITWRALMRKSQRETFLRTPHGRGRQRKRRSISSIPNMTDTAFQMNDMLRRRARENEGDQTGVIKRGWSSGGDRLKRLKGQETAFGWFTGKKSALSSLNKVTETWQLDMQNTRTLECPITTCGSLQSFRFFLLKKGAVPNLKHIQSSFKNCNYFKKIK